MSACCISGCNSKRSPSNKITLYSIPSGRHAFQVNRRKLWLKAIEQANGVTKEYDKSARVCSAHFISGKVSMEYGSADFVPSVFPRTEKKPVKIVNWFRRKRWHRAAKAVNKDTTSQPEADSPADVQSSDLIDDTETHLSLIEPLGEEELTDESENETGNLDPQTSPSPNKASPPHKTAAGIPKLEERIPTLILRRVFTPERGFRCEFCSLNFASVSQFLRHEQWHHEGKPLDSESDEESSTDQSDFIGYYEEPEPFFEEPEPSFPCNMCDRSFCTSGQLKRHKLLHVKDGRRCPTCGVIFCKLHNHVLFLPQPESEEKTSFSEPEISLLNSPESDQISDSDSDTESTTFSPLPKKPFRTLKPLPPPSHTRVLTEIPIPVLKKQYCIPDSGSGHSGDPLFIKPQTYYLSALRESSFSQDIELPPSLQMFSPKALTSALLNVTRDYDYYLCKSQGYKKEKE